MRFLIPVMFLSLLALAAAIVFQVLEMRTYQMF